MTVPVIQDVRLLHADPFGQEMVESLREDLSDALWARFMVCYFNEDGYSALSPALVSSLRDPRSRGIITLTCACGVGALERLRREAAPPRERVKVFLQGRTDSRDEDAKLLHSKMVMIVRPRRRPPAFSESPLEAILYVGSHNWTGPGLRCKPGGRANVETSVRIVADWNPAFEKAWLEQAERSAPGSVGNPILDALAQMARCFSLRSCTDLAAPSALVEFQGWMSASCTAEGTPPGATWFLVLTAVQAGAVDATTATSGTSVAPPLFPSIPRAGQQLFVQHYNWGDEPDVFDSAVTWAVLLWESEQALKAAEQPWLILCRPVDLGQEGAGDPNLRNVQWLLYDPAQNSPAGAPRLGTSGSRRASQSLTVTAARLRSGTAVSVEYWTAAPVVRGEESARLNARSPDRHALVTVIDVRAPRGRDDRGTTWSGHELPFHDAGKRTRRRQFLVFDEDGRPSEERARAIIQEQARLFGIEPDTDRNGLERGPTGNPVVGEAEVYPCSAPINDLLYRAHHGDFVQVLGSRRDTPRPVRFEVARADQDSTSIGDSRKISRMERLMAPGVPHVAKALGLSDVVVDRLGLRRK